MTEKKDTEWELRIDEMVKQNISCSDFTVLDIPPGVSRLQAGHTYTGRVSVKNQGSEVYFERVQLRVVAENNFMEFSRESRGPFSHRVEMITEGLGRDESFNFEFAFRPRQDIRLRRPISDVLIGIYAIVRPEGHSWKRGFIISDTDI